jgi:hypothetical protein
MSPQSKYIYGIVEELEPKTFGFTGVGGSGVYTINNQELAAVVSDVELQEIDPTRRNVHAHTLVQDELLKKYTLLPMAFGMIADGEDEVRILLESNHQSLLSELKRLTGMIEVELKVFWDQEAMIKELQGESQSLSLLKSKIQDASSAIEAQSMLIEAGRMVERIVLDWKSKCVEAVYAVLKELSMDVRLNKPLGIHNILNASFLIDKDSESRFQEEIYRMDAQYQGKLNFKYIGPLPPYNFISLKLEPARWL